MAGKVTDIKPSKRSPQQKSLTESRSAIIIKWIMGIPMLPAKCAGRMGEQMIKSMTGFGRCEICEDNRKFTVEMKSVNHRYLDVNLKMPKKLNFFEAAIRNLLKEYIQRGKVDVFITYEKVSIRYNKDVAAKYLDYLRQMSADFGLEDDTKLSSLARFPEVFSMEEEEPDEEGIWKTLEKALRSAAEGFVTARVREGEALKTDLCAKLDEMKGYVDEMINTVRTAQ